MKKSTIIVTAIFVVAIALAADVRAQDTFPGWKKSRTSNLNLEGIVNEIVDIMKRYELREVHGDRYSGQWVVEAFQKDRNPLLADRAGQIGFLSRARATPCTGQH